MMTLEALKEKAFWKHFWKEENAGNLHFFFFFSFPTMFSILWKTTSMSWVTFNMLSANAFSLDQSKTLSFGKGLNSLTIFGM